MRSAMVRPTRFRTLLFLAIAIVCVLGASAAQARTLRLVTQRLLPFDNLENEKAPGLSAEIIKQVLAGMGQDVSFEPVPFNRAWAMIARGGADGIFSIFPITPPVQTCAVPDEPLAQARYVMFIRSADVGKLKFSSFDDLVGHDVAVRGSPPGLFTQPAASPEMWEFLLEHHNMVETEDAAQSLRMLAAGRVDYALASLPTGMAEIAEIGLSGKIVPLLSRDVMEENLYICFTKGRVSPAFVADFSDALKRYKQTGAYRAIYRKYLP